MLEYLKSQLIQQYGTYSSNKISPNSIEIEARFGTVKGEADKARFVNEIAFSHYDRLLNYLRSISQPIITDTQEHRMGDVRRIQEGGKISWGTKTPLWSTDDVEFGIRLSIASESKITPIPTARWLPTVVRAKHRNSFQIHPAIRVDLTEVNQTLLTDKTTTHRFEVEMEITDPQLLFDAKEVDMFFSKLEVVFKALYGTERIWTFKERGNVIEYINQQMHGKPSRDFIDGSRIRQARNLRWPDLVMGGIIGNEDTAYAVFHKADGVRKLIVVSPWGVWSVYQHEFNKISDAKYDNLTGTILYAEEIPHEARLKSAPKTDYWWMVFDCVSSPPQVNHLVTADVSKQNLGQRYYVGQSLIDLLASLFNEIGFSATIQTMKYSLISSIDGFFAVFNEFLDEQVNLPYKNDGLIIFPFDSDIQPYSDKKPLDQRILTRYPDVCKWKPAHMLSNDLQIQWKALPDGSRRPDVYVLDNVDKLFRIPNVRITMSYDARAKVQAGLSKGDLFTFRWNAAKQEFTFVGPSRRPFPMSTDKAMDDFGKASRWETPDRHKILFDFRVKYNDVGGLDLYTSDTIMSPFRGSDRFPFSPDNIVVKEIIKDIGSGAIVEFTPGIDGKLVPIRVRHDKSTPNRSDIAIDNWNLARDPIPESTLRGEDLGILNHNLANKLSTYLEAIGNKDEVLVMTSDNSLDSHRDIRIEAYPNVEDENVDTVQQLDEHGVSIFYRSFAKLRPDVANKLLATIKPGNKVVILDINTDRLSQFFNPSLTNTSFASATFHPLRIRTDDNGVSFQLSDVDDSNIGTTIYHKSLSDILALNYKIDSVSDLSTQELYPTGLRQWAGFYSLIILTKQMASAVITALPESIQLKVPKETSKQEEPSRHLPALPVEIPYDTSKKRSISIIPNVVAKGDDAVQKLKVSWYNKPIYRIATIGGGDCFFHAYLKGFYKPYQDNNIAKFRIDMAKQLRKRLADTLPNIYETVASGQLPILAKETGGQAMTGVDYSLKGLQQLLNSDQVVGDEVYSITAEAVGVDVYILSADIDDLYIHLDTAEEGVAELLNRKAVIIVGNKFHYEVVAAIADNTGLLQTFFPPNHELIQAIKRKAKKL